MKIPEQHVYQFMHIAVRCVILSYQRWSFKRELKKLLFLLCKLEWTLCIHDTDTNTVLSVWQFVNNKEGTTIFRKDLAFPTFGHWLRWTRIFHLYLHKCFPFRLLYELNGFIFFYTNCWQHGYSSCKFKLT